MTIPQIVKIPSVGSCELIQANHIIRLEGWQKYTKFFLLNGSCLLSSYPIGTYEAKLTDQGFVRVHKSHIINLQHIEGIEKGHILRLTDHSRVPIARRKRKSFWQLIKTQNVVD